MIDSLQKEIMIYCITWILDFPTTVSLHMSTTEKEERHRSSKHRHQDKESDKDKRRSQAKDRKDRESDIKHKKRRKHDDYEGGSRKHKHRKKDNLTIVDNDENDDDLWVEKNVDIEGERVCTCSYDTIICIS